MPLDESDSHVKVNCVFVGVVFSFSFSFSFSNRLTLLGPRGGEECVAALAIAVEIIPWSEVDSPGAQVRTNSVLGEGRREMHTRRARGRNQPVPPIGRSGIQPSMLSIGR